MQNNGIVVYLCAPVSVLVNRLQAAPEEDLRPTLTGKPLSEEVQEVLEERDAMDKPDELLLTPASLLLPAQASEVIRFFYKGPADEKERYYRIVWFDQALSDAQRDNANRSAVATASARIGTILVVAPRQANYHFQYANGSLTNTGNATLRILAYGPCLKAANGKECKENYYLMPGKSRRFTRVDTADNKGRVALWQGDKFIPVK